DRPNEALHLAAPFKLEDDEDDWKTGESPKTDRITIAETQSPMPLFSLLPSVQNFLRCLLSSIDRSGSSCAPKLDADWPTGPNEALHFAAPFKLEDDEGDWKTGESPKDLPNNHRGNPIPNAPL